jgi:23S rRNA (adenine2503-C2)-methyltransferase
MCDAGAMGFHGNLSANDILKQVREIVERNPDLGVGLHPKVKIHFARMGEPALNPEVLKALQMLAHEFPHPGVMPSLSTVAPKSPAVDPFFDELIRVKNDHFSGGRFQLQFSLHSMDERKKREIVPIRTWSFGDVACYAGRFLRRGDRKITLNFALASGEVLDTQRVVALFQPDRFLIKITPINPTATARKHDAIHLWIEAPEATRRSAEKLKAAGFDVILSPSLPEEISAETSCGQLWSVELKRRAAVMLKNRSREAESYVTTQNLTERALAWGAALEKFRRRSLTLHPDKAALLVVDVQQLFLDPGSAAYMPPARAIVHQVQRLADSFRKAGRPVYFTIHAHDDPEKDGGLMPLWWNKVCLANSPEAMISPLLDPEEGTVFRKCRYSAFANSDLEKTLRRDGIKELVIVGLATNLCVESTVRSAFDLGFKVFVALDATAAHTEELHLAALKNLAWGFASVRGTEQLLKEITSPSPSDFLTVAIDRS